MAPDSVTGTEKDGHAVHWTNSSLCVNLLRSDPQGFECLPDRGLTEAQKAVVQKFKLREKGRALFADSLPLFLVSSHFPSNPGR
jgi:hypothetical protein